MISEFALQANVQTALYLAGWNSLGNAWLACKTCNMFKGDRRP